MRHNPAKGLMVDLDELLERFSKTQSVRYEDFVAIWKDMNMTCIMCGRRHKFELRMVRPHNIDIVI